MTLEREAQSRGLRYGRKPPVGKPALELSDYLTGVLPAHPDRVDYLAAMNGGWNILGNDRYGDCVAVGWANDRRVVSKTIGSGESYPNEDQVLSLYRTQNPNFPADDNGMDIQTALEFLVKNGGPDGVKALGFAKVDYTKPDVLNAATAIFGGILWGVSVLNSNMDDFDAGRPWDYSNSGVDGGHCVRGGGYQPAGAGSGALAGVSDFVTWGQETSFTQRFISQQAEEAWVVIWPEHVGTKAFQEGVNQAALAADYQALTGRPFPAGAPVPPPPPPAPPTQPIDPADKALVKAWTTFHSAFHTWRTAKGI